MTLVEFLWARLDDDQRAALDWQESYSPSHPSLVDPARVLAEVDAKRRIVKLHGPAYEPNNPEDRHGSPGDARYCRGCNANFVEEYAYLLDECPTKRLLALPHVDHPDYDPAWRV